MIYTNSGISIVIPSFNGKDLLKKNLPGIIKNFPGIEIIIVDDGSTDKTTDFIKDKYPFIKIIINKKNFGFSTSANKGILSAKSNLVLLLNNDCLPKENFLNLILPYFKHKNTFAVGCAEYKNGKIRGRGIGGFRRGFLYHAPGKLDKNNTLWAFGASTIYNKEIFIKLNGFDENFNPFYWEDFDLCYRSLKSGYKIYFEREAKIFHEDSATINKYYSAAKIQQISFRNQFLTCWKDITDINLLISHLLWLPYYLIWINIKTKGNLFIGFVNALTKIRNILRLRKQNNFVYSDSKILNLFQDED